MITRCLFAVVLAALVGLSPYSPLGAGDKKSKEAEKKKEPEQKKEKFKGIDVDGELINADVRDRDTGSYSKSYTFQMEKDQLYQIDLNTNAFPGYLRLETSTGTALVTQFGQPASIVYKPSKTEDFQIVVASQNNGVGKFSLSIRDPSASMIFTATEKLEQNDKAYNNTKRKHKLFLVDLEEGKSYQIDMKSKAFDSYMYFESPDGKLITEDDDGGGFPDSRIVYKAQKTGKYRIIASHFDGNYGEFTITVRQTGGAPRVEMPKDGGKKLPESR